MVSPISVNVELMGLRAVFNVALRWRLIEKNPFSKMELVRTPPAFFSKEDFQRLISFVEEPWLKEIIIFAAVTGMRRGETLNLRWENVDLTRKLIHIHCNPTFKTKQGKQRSIPLNDVAFNLLTMRHTRSLSDYGFTINGKIILGNSLTKAFKHYVRMVGLNDKLHFHNLRHTLACWRFVVRGSEAAWTQ